MSNTDTLIESVEHYIQLQQWAQALELAKAALKQVESQYGINDIKYYNISLKLQKIYFNLADYENSIIYAKLDSSLSLQHFGNKSEQYAKALIELADNYYKCLVYEETEPLYKNALEILQNNYKPDNPETASLLNKMANFLDDLDRIDDAEKYNDQALQIRRNLYKEDNADLAYSILNKGYFCERRGNINDAEKYYEESLKMYRNACKDDNPDLAFCINNLALISLKLGKFDRAETLFKEALEMKRRLYKGNNESLAKSINNLADIYRIEGKYIDAEPLYKEAIQMNRMLFTHDNPNLAQMINNLAVFYSTLGRYSEAEPLYIESLSMYRRLFKNDNPGLAGIINNVADFYTYLGRFSEAEPLFIEALEMNRRIYKEDNPDLIASILNLASFYRKNGKYTEGEPLFKEALEMSRRYFKSDNPVLATTINNVAAFYDERGMYDEAEKLYIEQLEMSRRIYKGNHPDLATSINTLAAFLGDRGKFEDAEALYKEALEMRRKLFNTDHPDLATSLSNLAYLYESRGMYKESEPLYKEALDMRRRIFHGDNPVLANSINNIALYYANQNKFQEAEQLLKEALAMKRRLFKDEHPDLVQSIYSMAKFYIDKDDCTDAEPLCKETFRDIEKIINDYFPSLSEREKGMFWGTLKGYFESYNTFAFNRASLHPEQISTVFDNRLSTKAILLNSVKKVRQRIHASGDSVLIDLFRQWQSNREFLIKLYQLPANSTDYQDVNVDSLEKATNEIEKQLSKRSELFAKEFEKKTITWKDIKNVLKDNEAAIEIIRYRKYGLVPNKFKPEILIPGYTDSIDYAFLIITNKTSEHPELVLMKNGADLEDMFIKQLRHAVMFKYDDYDSYNVYWGELADKLKGFTTIFISPDGVYNKINLNTLYDTKSRKYLLDELDLRYVTNIRDLLTWNENAKVAVSDSRHIVNSASLFGDPLYNVDTLNPDKQGKELIPPLPGTRVEIEKITENLKEKNWVVNTYLGNNAKESAVKSIDNPRLLHIATHGLFLKENQKVNVNLTGGNAQKLSENPLLMSMLLFTGSENTMLSREDNQFDSDDGILTAYEAMNLNLDNTELVVLSACETGLGEVKNGEGVYGLQRAFQVAGAKSLIMSLWTVSDEATQELMTSFYTYWLGGISKREAFRKAQLDLKQSMPNTYYWGAFVMIGE
ncbi:MAG: CHAT domain-containing tetratricopeptide repeat protein [FCB group bacterium]|jgi:CHAT domain-containing protein/Flp pilus assembly protein TadD